MHGAIAGTTSEADDEISQSDSRRKKMSLRKACVGKRRVEKLISRNETFKATQTYARLHEVVVHYDPKDLHLHRFTVTPYKKFTFASLVYKILGHLDIK